MKTLCRCFALPTLLLIAAIAARAQNAWTAPWQNLESGIMVQFSQVNARTCTWRFKNLSEVSTIQSMTFAYTYLAGPNNWQTAKDVLPSPLGPGQMVGGWAAFSAPANCTTVRINVLDRQWQ
jgi:hypothetical protein